MSQPDRDTISSLLSNQKVTSRQANFKKGCFHQFKDKKYDIDTFYKVLYWEVVVIEHGHLRHKTFRYDPTDFPCFKCEKSQDIQFSIQAEGVCFRCMYCHITSLAPCFDAETNQNFAELVQDEEVSLEEGQKIITRIGQNSDFLAPLIGRPRPETRRIHTEE